MLRKEIATDEPELDAHGNVVLVIKFLLGMAERIVNLNESPVTLDGDGKREGVLLLYSQPMVFQEEGRKNVRVIQHC